MTTDLICWQQGSAAAKALMIHKVLGVRRSELLLVVRSGDALHQRTAFRHSRALEQSRQPAHHSLTQFTKFNKPGVRIFLRFRVSRT